MRSSEEVVIIGGGPAGASCAARLRQRGLDPLVVDSRPFPRDKVCGGWITPQVVHALDLDLADYCRGRVLQPITAFRTGMIGDAGEVETRYGTPVSYGIRRCEFDHYLLQRSGARCRLGESVRTVRWCAGHWLINDAIQARMLVGAGGHFCPLARQLGARRATAAPVVAAQEVEFEIPAAQDGPVAVAGEMPELYFCRDLAGYGWCFRKGNFLNIGLGRIGDGPLGEHLGGFAEFLRARGKVRCTIPRFHGHAYQLYGRQPPRLYDDGAVLVGDAAGLAYPQSGEGILPAIESGLLAAEVIAAAAGDYRSDHLAAYRRRLEARFGRPTRRWTEWLPAPWLAALARRALASPWFVRRVVLDAWFLHVTQARREATP